MRNLIIILSIIAGYAANAQNVTWYVSNGKLFAMDPTTGVNFALIGNTPDTPLVTSKYRHDSLVSAASGKQATLVSGTNIKTVNGNSLLGSGDISITAGFAWGNATGTLSDQTDLQTALNAKQATLVSGTNIKTVNSTSLLGSGDISITTVSGNAGTATALQTARNINGVSFNGSADITTAQFIRLTSTYTLTSQTGLQKIFNSTTNGAFTAAGSTSYRFEVEFDLSSMSATSGNFGFGFLGTATLTSVKYVSTASKTAIGTPSTTQITTSSVATATGLVSANTTTTGHARITGIVAVNAGGTLIPAVSLGVAAAAVVGVNSYFSLTPIGTNTQTSTSNFN